MKYTLIVELFDPTDESNKMRISHITGDVALAIRTIESKMEYYSEDCEPSYIIDAARIEDSQENVVWRLETEED